MTSRRQFLGAAAALASLPVVGVAEGAEGDEDDQEADEEDDRGGGVFAHFATDTYDGGATYTVRGHRNEPNAAVTVSFRTGFGSFSVDLAPEEAVAFAEDVVEATRVGMEGDQ
jgi:hypothetical protein